MGVGLAARGRLWVRVLLLLCTHFCGPVLLTFCQVEGAHEVDLDGTSSPTSRGCRVLEVVPPYLRAVYLNRPATRNGESSSARCPEHVTTRCSQMLRVQTREGAQRFMWGCSTRCVGLGWCIIVYGAVGK